MKAMNAKKKNGLIFVERHYSLRDVDRFLRTSCYPKTLNSNQKDALNKYSKNFLREDSVLYYVGKDRKKKCQVVFEETEKAKVFDQCHMTDMGAHKGIIRTTLNINHGFYWLGITKYVRDRITACEQCQRPIKGKAKPPVLRSIETKEPWHILGIHLIKTPTTSLNGYSYVLMVICLFSEWIEAVPLVNKSVSEVAKFLKSLFFRFGAPQRVFTGEGREFINNLNKLLYEFYKVKHLVASAHHLQVNGQDARTNQTVKRALGQIDTQNNWDEHLLPVIFSHNSSQQTATQFSPHYIMFGREARLFSEINDTPDIFSVVNVDGATPYDLHEQIERPKPINNAVQVDITRKEKEINRCQFQCGDLVLVRNTVKKIQVGDKLDYEWRGPYKIEFFLKSGVILSSNGKIFTSKVSVRQLKPYLKQDISTTVTVSCSQADGDHNYISNVDVNGKDVHESEHPSSEQMYLD